jgi:hypothetical protein
MIVVGTVDKHLFIKKVVYEWLLALVPVRRRTTVSNFSWPQPVLQVDQSTVEHIIFTSSPRDR